MALTFSFVNIMTQLTSEEPLSPDTLTQATTTMFLYGLRNTVRFSIAIWCDASARPL
jgi:hypothetical protein